MWCLDCVDEMRCSLLINFRCSFLVILYPYVLLVAIIILFDFIWLSLYSSRVTWISKFYHGLDLWLNSPFSTNGKSKCITTNVYSYSSLLSMFYIIPYIHGISCQAAFSEGTREPKRHARMYSHWNVWRVASLMGSELVSTCINLSSIFFQFVLLITHTSNLIIWLIFSPIHCSYFFWADFSIALMIRW